MICIRQFFITRDRDAPDAQNAGMQVYAPTSLFQLNQALHNLTFSFKNNECVAYSSLGSLIDQLNSATTARRNNGISITFRQVYH